MALLHKLSTSWVTEIQLSSINNCYKHLILEAAIANKRDIKKTMKNKQSTQERKKVVLIDRFSSELLQILGISTTVRLPQITRDRSNQTRCFSSGHIFFPPLMLKTSQLVVHHAVCCTENTIHEIASFCTCVSSESPHSIGAHRKLRLFHCIEILCATCSASRQNRCRNKTEYFVLSQV